MPLGISPFGSSFVVNINIIYICKIIANILQILILKYNKTFMQTHKFKWKLFDVEYSSVRLLELEGEKRLSSEYYDVEYIKVYNNILTKSNEIFFDNIIDFSSWKNLIQSEKWTPFLRTQNIKSISIDENWLSYTEEGNLKLLESWDLIFVRVWWAWDSSVVYWKMIWWTFSDNVLRLKLKNINPFYSSVFFNSSLWRAYFKHVIKWTAQPLISKENFKNLLIPIPSSTFQEKIEELVIESYKQKELSEKLYKEAETLLLTELDLFDYKPKTKNINLISWYSLEVLENHSTTNYSILKELDRFDAEYFDYSYFEIIEKIKNYKWWFDKLINLAKLSKKKIILDEEQNYNYIELADINKSNWMVENTTEILWKNLPSRARMKIEKWSVLFSSLDGSIDKVAIVDINLENLVASTWFFIFKENILNKETLLVLLKIFWQKYISREALGSIMSAISNTGIERVLLPKIEDKIQKIVSQKIQESFTSKTKSKNLLEIAKKAVEIYIEEDEENGFEFINTNV